MDFRIIKTKARPKHHWSSKYDGVDWFIVQYRNDPSIWNLWSPRWKKLIYNQEEHLRYPSITKPKLVSAYCCSCWRPGYLIPTYKLAWQLLDTFKNKHNYVEDNGEEIVYQSSTRDGKTAKNLVAEYNCLVNGSVDEDKNSVPANKASRKQKRG